MQETDNEWVEHWLFHTPAYVQDGGIRLIRAGCNRAKPDFQTVLRQIQYYSLYLIREGRGFLHIDGQQFEVEAGDLFVIYPNQKHHYRTDSEQPFSLFWLSFDGAQATSLLLEMKLSQRFPLLSQMINDRVEHLLEEFMQVCQQTGHKLAAIGLFYLLIDHFATLAEQKKHPEEPAEQWLMRSIAFMNRHYAHISVNEVANYVHINRSHFTTAFTRMMSTSPLRYLTLIRMHHASDQLLQTDNSIADISQSVGYHNPYSFTRAFKKDFGMSPLTFRQQRHDPELQKLLRKPPLPGTVIFLDDFDDQGEGSSPLHYQSFGETVQISRSPELIGHALHITKSLSGVTYAERSFAPIDSSFRFTCRIRVHQSCSPVGLHFLDEANRFLIRVSLNNAGTLSYYSEQHFVRTAAAYSTYTWNDIEVIFHKGSMTYDFRYNHRMIETGIPAEPGALSASKFRLMLQHTGEVYVDNIQVVQLMEPDSIALHESQIPITIGHTKLK